MHRRFSLAVASGLTAACVATVGAQAGSASPAAHRSGKAAQELSPGVYAASLNAHSVKVTLTRSKFQTKVVGYKVYVLKGLRRPKALSHLPSRKPDRNYSPRHLHTFATLKFHHLKTRKPYTFLAYGYDKHGHVGGSYSSAYPLDDGLHVSDTKFYVHHATGGAVVRDDNGRERMVGLVHPNSKSDPGGGHLVYATGRSNSSHWTMHAAGALDDNSHGTVALALGTDGKTVSELVDACGEAGTAQTPISSTRMPALSPLYHQYFCEDPEDEPVRAVGLVAVPHDKVLVAATAVGDATATAEYLTGKPNGTLAAHQLPDGDQYHAVDLTRDASSGKITVLGQANGGGDYVTWSGTPGGTWTGPTTGPTAPADTDSHEASMTSGKGKVYVAFQQVSGGDNKATETKILWATRSKSGHWSAFKRLPHSTFADILPVLYLNAATGHLHAAWTRDRPKCATKCSGIMHQALLHGKWHKPSFVTHWYGDVTTNITVTKSGHAIIGYLRS